MVTFAWQDFAVVAAILAAFLLLGFSARLRENTAIQMIAAGRRLTLPLLVATLVTTWYGGILGIGEAFGFYGLGIWLILGLPYYLFGLAFAFFMAKRVRGEEDISLPERIARVYGRPAALIAAILVALIAAPAAHVFMLGTLVNLTTEVRLEYAVILGTVLGSLFLYRGGLLADARSNTVSFVMMYASFALILFFAVREYGAPTQILSQLPADKQNLIPNNDILFALSWFFLGSWTFVDPGFHQRVASALDPATSKKGVIVSVCCWVVFDLLSMSVAMYAFHAMQNPELGANLFPLFGDMILPSGLKGVFFAGMFGVITSAMVGYTLVCGSTLGRDIAMRVANAPEDRAVLFTRFGIAGATVIGIALALAIPSVVYLWYDLGAVAIPGLFYPTLFAYAIRKPLSPRAAVACLVAGSGSVVLWYTLLKFTTLAETAPNIAPIFVGLIMATAALIAASAARQKQ